MSAPSLCFGDGVPETLLPIAMANLLMMSAALALSESSLGFWRLKWFSIDFTIFCF